MIRAYRFLPLVRIIGVLITMSTVTIRIGCFQFRSFLLLAIDRIDAAFRVNFFYIVLEK